MSPNLYRTVVPFDPPERAADVQPPFVLQDFHAARADGGVDVFIDPCPWDGRHLRQIDGAGNAAHSATAMPVRPWQPCVLTGFSPCQKPKTTTTRPHTKAGVLPLV